MQQCHPFEPTGRYRNLEQFAAVVDGCEKGSSGRASERRAHTRRLMGDGSYGASSAGGEKRANESRTRWWSGLNVGGDARRVGDARECII